MAPGSVHPKTGKLYREETPWTLEILQQCPVYDPTWLPCECVAKPKTGHRSSVAVPRAIDATDHDEQIADVDVPVAERERQVRVYLDSVPGTQEGTGADGRCSALTLKLLYGFALSVGVVQDMLIEWGQREDQLDDARGWYPWTEEDIARKIEWCRGQEYRGEVGDKLHAIRDFSEMEAKVDEIVVPFGETGSTANSNKLVISPKNWDRANHMRYSQPRRDRYSGVTEVSFDAS